MSGAGLRGLRRVLLGLVVVAGLLGGAVGAGALLGDEPARRAAERAIAERVQRSERLAATPQVSIEGGRFLPQALRGSFDRVQLRAADVPAGPVRLATLDADLRGVRVPPGDALRGRVRDVPVASMRVLALIRYDELERAVGDDRVSLAPAGDRLRVRGRVTVLGRELSVAADSDVELVGDTIGLRARRFYVGDAVAPAAVARAIGDRLDRRVAAPELPFGLRLDRTVVTPGGLEVAAGATDTVIRT